MGGDGALILTGMGKHDNGKLKFACKGLQIREYLAVFLAPALAMSSKSLSTMSVLISELQLMIWFRSGIISSGVLLSQGIEAANTVISGDGLPMPAGAYLLSPWADLTHSGQSHSTKGSIDTCISHDFLASSAVDYAGNRDPYDPSISPVFADLRGFPPLLVQVGSHERLLSDSTTFTKNAGEADVPATLTISPGYPHLFQFYNRDLEGRRKALKIYQRGYGWKTVFRNFELGGRIVYDGRRPTSLPAPAR